MKRKLSVLILLIFTTAFLAARGTSRDIVGKIGVTGVGRLPRGMFVRARGYVPGDYINVASDVGNVRLLVVGTLPRENYYALLVTKEVAKMLGVRTGDDITIEKRNSDFTSPFHGKLVLNEKKDEADRGTSSAKSEISKKTPRSNQSSGDSGVQKKLEEAGKNNDRNKRAEISNDEKGNAGKVQERKVKKDDKDAGKNSGNLSKTETPSPRKNVNANGEDLTLVRADSVTPKEREKKLAKKNAFEAGGNVIYIDINNNIYPHNYQQDGKKDTSRGEEGIDEEEAVSKVDNRNGNAAQQEIPIEDDLYDDDETEELVENSRKPSEETEDEEPERKKSPLKEDDSDGKRKFSKGIKPTEGEPYYADESEMEKETYYDEDDEIIDDPYDEEDELYYEDEEEPIGEDEFFGRDDGEEKNGKKQPYKVRPESKDSFDEEIIEEEIADEKAEGENVRGGDKQRKDTDKRKRKSLSLYGEEEESVIDEPFEEEKPRVSKKRGAGGKKKLPLKSDKSKSTDDEEQKTSETAFQADEKLPLEKKPSELFVGTYYVQICLLKDRTKVKSIVDKYSLFYPMSVVRSKTGEWQVLVGPLGRDEYGVVRERFRSYGFKDAFVKRIKENKNSKN